MYVTSLVRRLRKLVAAMKRLSLTSLPNPSQFTNESQTPKVHLNVSGKIIYIAISRNDATTTSTMVLKNKKQTRAK
jgi:hypothetical protein